MTALVEIADAAMMYGTGEAAVQALRGVSLDIRRGEMLMLMGPSGSGKTTLLQVAGALIAPTAGEVRILGQRIDGLTQSERGVVRLRHFGFVFQNYNLFPTLTAQENVEVALDLRGTPLAARRRIAREALDAVGLADRAGSYPAKLSGGQKQRVAIARALAMEPPVILADEPTGNLDSMSSTEIMRIIRSLNTDRGITTILVTHEPDIAAQAKRLVKFKDGRIVYDGPVTEAGMSA